MDLDGFFKDGKIITRVNFIFNVVGLRLTLTCLIKSNNVVYLRQNRKKKNEKLHIVSKICDKIWENLVENVF